MWSVADGGVVEHCLWVIWVGAVMTKNGDRMTYKLVQYAGMGCLAV
jgi:hypothetical protein